LAASTPEAYVDAAPVTVTAFDVAAFPRPHGLCAASEKVTEVPAARPARVADVADGSMDTDWPRFGPAATRRM
jgi:hypothetical protein